MPTIIYRNTSKKTVVLPVTGDEVEPGETISLTSEFPQPLNHPDLVNITNETADELTEEITSE
jgi:hypothetical protein